MWLRCSLQALPTSSELAPAEIMDVSWDLSSQTWTETSVSSWTSFWCNCRWWRRHHVLSVNLLAAVQEQQSSIFKSANLRTLANWIGPHTTLVGPEHAHQWPAGHHFLQLWSVLLFLLAHRSRWPSCCWVVAILRPNCPGVLAPFLLAPPRARTFWRWHVWACE